MLAGPFGCSALATLDNAPCEVNEDCEALGDGLVCADDGFCEPAEGCLTNQECIEQEGEFNICRKSDNTCVSLLTNECIEVIGDYTRDDAFMFGTVVPLRGDSQGAGLSPKAGIELALNDIESTVNGLPSVAGSSERRPLVLVACSDDADSDQAVVASQHLVDELEVPAIIGAAFSGITIRVATEVTIPAGVLTFSPAATSIAITTIEDNGLVWRSSPSDEFQAEALAKFTPQIEQRIRDEAMLADTDPVSMMILNKADAYGSGLAIAFEQQLVLNGAPAQDPSNTDNYARFDYGDPDSPDVNPPRFGEAVSLVLERQPRIIALMGTREMFSDLMGQIEGGWDDSVGYRPQYLLPDGGVDTLLWNDIVQGNDELRRRVQGTIPGTASPLFNTFRTEFNSRFSDPNLSPETFGAAGAYDITYLLFYAAALIGEGEITGQSLAAQMGRFIGGNPAQVGKNNLSQTLQTLLAGDSIDFEGASGPLDFDLMTGEAPSDILIWCLPTENDGSAGPSTPSGIFFSAATRELTGTDFGPDCDR